MCPKVKRYKGKEMRTSWGTKREQNLCLEGDTASEGKVKKVLCNIGAARLEVEGFHLGFLVNVVFAGIAEAVLKAARFGGKSPDEAFARGQGFGGAVEDFVLKCEGSVDPLPTGGLES